MAPVHPASSLRDGCDQPLLSDVAHAGAARGDAPQDARSLTTGFFVMAAAFSINHGTVTGQRRAVEIDRPLTLTIHSVALACFCEFGS
jgi:hypothetical protein